MLASCLMAIESLQLNAAVLKTDEANLNEAKPIEEKEAMVLLLRLDEIEAMDISGLSASKKMDLRNEVRIIKSELSDSHGGVYLSVGAIILIVLLLILLL